MRESFEGNRPRRKEVDRMGQRGPKPGSGGRPKKALADKIADGNPGKRPLTVIDFKDSAADLEGQDMPKPSAFLSAKQKDGTEIRIECDSVVNGIGFVPAPIAPDDHKVYRVGTCEKWGNLRNVIWGAWDVCMHM